MDSGTLNGQLTYVFAVSILDAAILSWVAVRWYRRAVSRIMGQGSTAQPAAATVPAPAAVVANKFSPATPQSLDVAIVRPDGLAPATTSGAGWPVGWRRLAAAYFVGAALFSTIITLAAAIESPQTIFVGIFTQWWINLWPLVPTLAVLLVLDRRSTLRLAAGYVLCGSAALAALTVVTQLLRGTLDNAPLTNVFWFVAGLIVTAAVPALLILITGWRPIRGVTPLALAVTLLFGFALTLFRVAWTKAFNVPALRDVLLAMANRTSTDIAYYAPYMIVALPVGWLAWRALKALAGGFARKRFSDAQLIVDCWWLVVTADTMATSLTAPFGFAGIGAGLAAFAAYRAGVWLTLRIAPAAASGEPKRLLLLRVFGHETRTESLFDRIAQRWRFTGPVQLIAGVDLAMRTADPGDMLTFVGGRLRSSYISSLDELPDRVQRVDVHPDPDGRFRVNELYCMNDTWRQTLEMLLTVSDAVVMDLRGFTDKSRGCVFEVEQLVGRMPTGDIVLVCDKTTDLGLLAQLLGKAWVRAEADGVARRSGPVSLVRVERNSWLELDAVMRRLLGQSTPQQVLSVADLPPVLT